MEKFREIYGICKLYWSQHHWSLWFFFLQNTYFIVFDIIFFGNRLRLDNGFYQIYKKKIKLLLTKHPIIVRYAYGFEMAVNECL